ncbi:efflux RND transporter permease subunit [Agaribacterium haliotis]|uniref:efflux RND transporter permease subunit n=1 Tax=Agaribacterium haliotis TaxID=2013869 RepID=UPI000BB59890|nr:efflux RND transporter permease subunit [Agaribacterium haliotis]
MIAWFARNDVAANLLMLSIAMGGIYMLLNKIPLEFFPRTESDTIAVSVSLRGSSPEDAELALATRIEEAVKDLEGIKEYRSTSSEGGSTVTIEAEPGYDARELLDDVKNRVDAINTLPGEAERPIIRLSQYLRASISVTLSGDIGERELRELGEQIREELVQLPNVTQASLYGVRNYEVAVELNQDKMREFGLNLQQVADAINKSSLDLSAGNISSEGGEVLIRSTGQAYFQQDFENIVLLTDSDGTVLRLADIAEVNDGFEEKAVRSRFNGKPAATIDISAAGNQSIIEVANEVKNYVQEKSLTLSPELEINYWNDRSEVVKKRINTLTKNAIQGGILVILLLSLFLRPAVAFWVFLGIPVSFCGAWLVMSLTGVSLNMISLFAFIVVLGIVVDDAIVTGENVYTHLQHAEDGLSAAINGTKEVAVPVTFGILTTVAAFVPLAFIDGHRGALFAQIPMVVIPVLLFSLIESKLVLPAHLKHIKVSSKEENLNKLQRWQRSFAKGFEQAILKYYQPLLNRAIQYKFTSFALFLSLLLIIISSIILGHSRYTFFPRVPSEFIRFNLVMPVGTPFEVTDRHMQHIVKSALKLEDKYSNESDGQAVIEDILSISGDWGGDTHIGRAYLQLSSPETRSLKITSTEIAKDWRKLIGSIPGAEEITFRAEIGRTSDPIDVQVRGDNIETLELIAEQVSEQLTSYDGVFDINNSSQQGKQELRIELKDEAYVLGISRSDIVQQVRQAFFGIEAQRIQRGRNDVRVMVRFPIAERRSVAQLNSMLIRAADGTQVPLAQIATLSPDISPSQIQRIDGKRTLNISADIEKEKVNMTVLGEDLKAYMDELVARYPGIDYKFGGEQEEQQQSNRSMLYGFIGILFVIYCLLAIPFRSYLQPVIVMSIIPFGLIGAMVGHWIMGMNLTVMSLMGLLALTGVLVNDSLVLVDYINKTRQKGLPLKEAVLTAGAARFRPVMLTSLTTFIGLMPLLFEKETQAQFLIPMAISLGFGIMFATFITLLLVPINYMLVEGLKRRFNFELQVLKKQA